MCQENNNTKRRKDKHLEYSERQFINGNNKFPVYYAHISLKISLVFLKLNIALG